MHIHVKRDRQIAKFWLVPISLAKNRGFKDHEFNRIESIIHEHRHTLMEAGHDHLELETEPVAIDVKITDLRLTVDLADDRSITIPLEWYPRLYHGTPEERQNWQLLGDGYAIEWPDLDEHIGVEGLLAGRKSSESPQSIQRWLSSRQS